MLYKHLKWFETVQTTIPNEIISSNKQLRENKQNEIFDYNILQFTFIVFSFILIAVFMLGCQIQKTRITHFNKQINKENETKDNNKNKVRYHIIDHIIINVLPSSFHDFGSFTGLFHRKKAQEKTIDKEKQNEKYEKELEYLKKIV